MCEFEGCEKKSDTRGFCQAHYNKIQQAEGRWFDEKCADGCDRYALTRGYCAPHYNKRRNAGEFSKTPVCRWHGCTRRCVGVKDDLCSAHMKVASTEGALRDLKTQPGYWGKWYVTPGGYVVRKRGNGQGRNYQLQHRFFMQEHLGRELLNTETVHHKNGNRQDNRIENLEVWSGIHPRGARSEDQVEWATEILRLYRPEALIAEFR